jgi:hypothetical protein
MALSTGEKILLGVAGIGGIAGAAYLLSLKNAGDSLALEPIGLRYKGVKSLAFQFELDLLATNPTRTDLDIQAMLLQVNVGEGTDSKTIARIQATGEQKDAISTLVSGQSSALLTLPFYIPLVKGIGVLGITLYNAFFNRDKLPKVASITGPVKANGIVTEYNKTIPLSNAA